MDKDTDIIHISQTDLKRCIRNALDCHGGVDIGRWPYFITDVMYDLDTGDDGTWVRAEDGQFLTTRRDIEKAVMQALHSRSLGNIYIRDAVAFGASLAVKHQSERAAATPEPAPANPDNDMPPLTVDKGTPTWVPAGQERRKQLGAMGPLVDREIRAEMGLA